MKNDTIKPPAAVPLSATAEPRSENEKEMGMDRTHIPCCPAGRPRCRKYWMKEDLPEPREPHTASLNVCSRNIPLPPRPSDAA